VCSITLLTVFLAVAEAACAEIVEVSNLGTDAATNRLVLQRAINSVSAHGGGRVVLPTGVWQTGSIELKSGVELHVPKGVVLKGSANKRDYNANDAFPENAWSEAEEWSGGHLVWARCAENIAITGSGTIDGNGPAFFGDCDEDSRWPWYKYGLKLHPIDREWFRPGMMVAFFRCRGIRLEDIKLANTPAWTCHFRCCEGVAIRSVTIDADRTIANSDGFSIDCTRNVVVEKCVLKTGDDSFAIRASCHRHAETNLCENIIIRDCDVSSCCSGIRFGIGTGTIRNVRVSNLRIHEASDTGIGFTPAWISGSRNCYIEDVELKDCTISDCVRPMSAGADGNSLVANIRFTNCVFNTLLPSLVWGSDRCRIDFRDCTRNTIERFRIRHRWQWNEREICNSRSIFAEVRGDGSKVGLVNCRPRPFGSTGVLLLSFEGRDFAVWERFVPLLAKYGAHGTFFVSGEFDSPAVRIAKRLMASGHAIGLSGRYRPVVKRQCDVAYIPVRSIARLSGGSDGISDDSLLDNFDRIRVGFADHCLNVNDDQLFIPVRDLSSCRVLKSAVLDLSRDVDMNDVRDCICRAGTRNETLVLSVCGGGCSAFQRMDKILIAAKERNVAVLSYDEIPLER